MHSERMTSDEESSEVDLLDSVESCLEVGNLADIVADAEKEAAYDVLFVEIWHCIK